MPESIYWYDLETTGTDPVFDRPLQFAGIRTDLNLEEVGEPLNILCRPGNDALPNPEAIRVTGILMEQIEAEGMTERDFVERVMREFLQPQTCVTGFNNLRFDDEFMRQMLYRGFHDPYAREWRNGNSRWDVIDLFRCAYALRPDGFNWPEKEPGVPSFRLEDLAAANGIAHENAHDALADVRVTIEVTQRLRRAQPRLFDYLFRLRDKKQVLQQLYPLGKQPVVHVSSMYPAAKGCAALVLPLCQHPTNSNGIIVYDLAESPDTLLAVNSEELVRLVFSRANELAEGERRIPLKTIHINKSPAVAPLGTLGEAEAARLGIDKALCLNHQTQLQQTPGLVEKIQDAFGMNRFDAKEDPDEQLYEGGFFSESDRTVMQEVTQAEAADLDAFEGKFQDDRLDEMLFRFRARNWPQCLSEQERQYWDQYRWQRWQNGESLVAMQQRCQEMRGEASLSDRDSAALSQLAGYLNKLALDFTE